MRSQSRWTGIVVGVVMGVLFSAAVVLAGSLEPSAGPTADVSQMYTLEQIYNRINNGTAATKMTTFTEPSSGPTAPTMHTLDDIYALAGLRAPVPKTGQTTSYGTGSDGALQKGVAWPNPRFTDNANGTVIDNLTGLIWLKNANCFGARPWAQALSDASTLGGGFCGLIDGSTAGQWRLPNVKELHSLIDFAYYNPALSNEAGTGQWVEGNPFTGVQSEGYWSSTTLALGAHLAWDVHLGYGGVDAKDKPVSFYFVWPVRGGQ